MPARSHVCGNLLQVYGANSDGMVDPVDHDISEEMQHARLTFARYGVPLLKDGGTWPKVNETLLSTVWFGDSVMRGSYPQLSGSSRCWKKNEIVERRIPLRYGT